MKTILAAALISLSAGAAMAQTSAPHATTQGHTPAVATPNTANPAAPVAGANSFTEAQAKSRIEANGYTGVSALKKDDAGVWRGKGQKGGATQDVALDYQGNVVAK
jgi:hypothetical protein